MFRLLQNSWWIALVLVGSGVITAQAAPATPVVGASEGSTDTQLTQSQAGKTLSDEEILVENYSEKDPNSPIDQVTSVSQLSDVQPTDWAFQALQSLVERYGCIAGYPNSTFRGNRAMTRYEFAAGLNACLNRINELIATSTANLVTKDDLETLRKLEQEFADGLVELRLRIDGLEARAAVLTSQEFSTTTKLNAEVIFAIAGAFGDDRALNSDQWRDLDAATGASREAIRGSLFGAAGSGVRDNPILAERVRLNLDTSFAGKDLLRVRLETNNITAFNAPVTGTNMTRLGFDSMNPSNDILLGKIFYRFPVGDRLNIIVDAIGGEFFDNFDTINPLFSSAPTGAVSRFGRFSPIYRSSNTASAGNTGSGVSAILQLSDAITLSAGYLARRSNDPGSGRGLLDGSYGAIAQLAFQPNKDFTLGLTYAHSYFSGANNDVTVSGAYGSAFSNQPFGAAIATSANHYGIEANYRFNPKFVLSGWVAYTQAIAEGGARVIAEVNTGDRADIWSWAVTLGFPDLGRKGSVGGIIFGQPPKVTSNDFGPTAISAINPVPDVRRDSDTSFHLEALYRYQISSNISITPGLIVILNPEHNSDNDTSYTGVVRTTFRF